MLIHAIPVAPTVTMIGIATSRPKDSLQESTPEPGAELLQVVDVIECSADGAALIFCHDQLHMVPIVEVMGICAYRLHPAKGSGDRICSLNAGRRNCRSAKAATQATWTI